MSFHENEGYAATMVVHEVVNQIAYGVVRMDGTIFRQLEEKPLHRFHINTGVYAINTSAFESLPKSTSFGMPDLFSRLAEQNPTVVSTNITVTGSTLATAANWRSREPS